MRKRPLSRSLIALAAAYLVALQALILPLALPANGAAVVAAGSLCLTTHGGSVPVPAGQEQGCPCAAGCGMQCHAPAFGPAAAAAAIPAARPFIVAALAPAPLAQAPASALRGRPMPRGPPAA
jgi:hypothetical protein